MPLIPDAQLTHVGMYVRDLPAMTAFYVRVLGMVVSDGGPFGGRELAFLTRSADEHHQLVMIHDPARQEGLSALGQVSFRVADLESLRQFHALLSEMDVQGLEGRNHGNSWSIYLFDPEGNKIEIYVPTPWQVSQPWRVALDLGRPAQEIFEETHRLVQSVPGMQPWQDWSRDMAVRIDRAASPTTPTTPTTKETVA